MVCDRNNLIPLITLPSDVFLISNNHYLTLIDLDEGLRQSLQKGHMVSTGVLWSSGESFGRHTEFL